MPEEVSEPGPRDHRTQEIPLPVSSPEDLASEKRSSQDRARPTDQVLASIVMENSSVMVPVEFYSPAERYRRGRASGVEEAAAKV